MDDLEATEILHRTAPIPVIPPPLPPRARPRRGHPVIWFAAGTILWLAAAIELRIFIWLLRLHG